VKADYSHLHSTTRALAQESPEARIRRIRTDRWIAYSRAEEALSAMEELLTFPQRTRMPNLLLVGPTNNGKTMIIEKFRRSHPPTAASTTPEGVARIPIVKIQMPPGPDERRFFGAVLEGTSTHFDHPSPHEPLYRCGSKEAAQNVCRELGPIWPSWNSSAALRDFLQDDDTHVSGVQSMSRRGPASLSTSALDDRLDWCLFPSPSHPAHALPTMQGANTTPVIHLI